MKTPKILREKLLLTQQDMAMLLGVTRVQYAMFEIGERNLPPSAVKRYTQLLSQTEFTAAAKSVSRPINDQKLKDLLTRLLSENEYQLLKIARKIAAIDKKHLKAQQLSQLSALVNQPKTKSDKAGSLPYFPIADKTIQASTADRDLLLMQFRLRQELLEVERKFLHSKLKQ